MKRPVSEEAYKLGPIVDLEAYGLLTSLRSLQRFTSGVKVTLLTDSEVSICPYLCLRKN